MGIVRPGSLPTNTPRVTEPEPYRSRIVSSAESSDARSISSNGNSSWVNSVVAEVADRDPDERQPTRLDHRMRRGEQLPDRFQNRLRLHGRPHQRLRSGRPRKVVEPHPQHHRAPGPPGRPHPPRHPIDQPGEHRVNFIERVPTAPDRSLRPDRTPPSPHLDRTRVVVVRERMQMTARRNAEDRHKRRLAQPRDLTDRRMLRSCSLPAVTGPTPHSSCTGSGCRNSSSRSGATTSNPSGFATRLATLARNFVRATPTVIGNPTRRSTSLRSPAAISTGFPESGAAPRHQGTPRRSKCPRPAASCHGTPRRPPCSPPNRRTSAARQHRVGAQQPRRAPPIAVRTPGPSPRNSPRAPRHRRRSPDAPAAEDGHAAPPTRKKRRDPRA